MERKEAIEMMLLKLGEAMVPGDFELNQDLIARGGSPKSVGSPRLTD